MVIAAFVRCLKGLMSSGLKTPVMRLFWAIALKSAVKFGRRKEVFRRFSENLFWEVVFFDEVRQKKRLLEKKIRYLNWLGVVSTDKRLRKKN